MTTSEPGKHRCHCGRYFTPLANGTASPTVRAATAWARCSPPEGHSAQPGKRVTRKPPNPTSLWCTPYTVLTGHWLVSKHGTREYPSDNRQGCRELADALVLAWSWVAERPDWWSSVEVQR